MTFNLTPKSLEVFLAYAKDAGNWAGTPLVGGNVGTDLAEARAHRGNLTQLKQAGLITTWVDDGHTWLSFTDTGRELAATHGVVVE